MMVNNQLDGGVDFKPSEKYGFVSWDDDIPNWMEKKHVPNHQSVKLGTVVIQRA